MHYNNKFFKNKSVYVLGGNGLIGNSIVENFLKLDALVFILDKKIKKKSKKFEIKNKIELNFDLSNPKNLERNLNKIFLKYNVPDIFINCAYPKTKDWKKNNFESISFNSFKKNIELQLISNSWVNYLVAEKMKLNKIKGKIIHLGSIYGNISQDLSLYKGTSIKENFTYPLIKGGISKFMQQLAVYYAKYDILINTVSPGGILNNQDNKFISKYNNKTPINRMANPSEISELILFLSSEASSYILGQDILIDGGFTKI